MGIGDSKVVASPDLTSYFFVQSRVTTFRYPMMVFYVLVKSNLYFQNESFLADQIGLKSDELR